MVSKSLAIEKHRIKLATFIATTELRSFAARVDVDRTAGRHPLLTKQAFTIQQAPRAAYVAKADHPSPRVKRGKRNERPQGQAERNSW